MITSLHLKNFQGHADSLLEFTPGINAITGKSDNGKSCIVRALNYARYNRPASNNYPSHWIVNDKKNLTGEMSVSIQKGNDTVIRYRNKDENGYKINKEILKAINRDVPEQVESILSLSEVNIQKQLDSHFLLSETNGQKAQFFNSLVKMDEIDDYLSEAERLKRKNNKDIKELTEKLTEQEKELEAYSWIEKAEKLNKSLKRIEDDLQQLDYTTSSLISEINTYQNIEKALSELTGVAYAENLILQIEALPKPDYKTLNNLTQNYLAYKITEKILSELPDIERAAKLVNKISELPQPDYRGFNLIQEQIVEVNYFNSALVSLKDLDEAGLLISKIEKYNSRIKDFYIDFQRLNRVNAEYKNIVSDEMYILELLAELEKEMPEICPLCGNKLKGEM